jgi:phage-related protein
MVNPAALKPLVFVGSSREDLRDVPKEVRTVMGAALHAAQLGGRHDHAKPLKGFGGASVLEVVEDSDGDTYRAIYTVRLKDVVYVLHVFQKKSRRGSQTPRHEMDLVRSRLELARQIHESR